jgi:uncharacterized protein (TIGR03089 family)
VTHPAEVLAALSATDATRPRVTAYDGTQGPTRGERVELSGRVLGTWVAKAANALQEEWDGGPGTVVRVCLPAHWRALVWALATWSVGGCLALDEGPADLTVADDPAVLQAAAGDAVLVTLASLARSAPGPVPAGAMDEARELASYGDRFVPWARPADDDPALRVGDRATPYGSVVPQRDWPMRTRLHLATDDVRELIDAALGVWARDGSLVHSRGPVPPEVLAARLESERVSVGG